MAYLKQGDMDMPTKDQLVIELAGVRQELKAAELRGLPEGIEFGSLWIADVEGVVPYTGEAKEGVALNVDYAGAELAEGALYEYSDGGLVMSPRAAPAMRSRSADGSFAPFEEGKTYKYDGSDDMIEAVDNEEARALLVAELQAVTVQRDEYRHTSLLNKQARADASKLHGSIDDLSVMP